MSEKSSIQTKRRKQYSAGKLIKEVRQVTFFNVKIEKFVGGSSRQSRSQRQSFTFLVSGMLGGGI